MRRHTRRRYLADAVPDSDAGVLFAQVWPPGGPPRDLGGAAPEGAVLWIDVDPHAGSAELTQRLAPMCDGLEQPMVEDLLACDPLPGVDRHSYAGVRKVASFGVRAEDPADGAENRAGRLHFQPVELLAGERWLITCRHGHGADPRPAVSRLWATRGVTAGDLGVQILHALATSYPQARKRLYRWHAGWEHAPGRSHKGDAATLHALRHQVADFRTRLEALNQPGMAHDPERIWFAGAALAEAERVDDLIDRTLANLAAFAEVLRSSGELLATQAFTRHARKTEQFQDTIAVLAAVFLVPTLIAGVYGANTKLPGRDSWTGFAYMAALMIVSAVLSYFAIQWLRGRE
jgi:Mg2+ and Co2+ transporter CorA